MVAFTAASVLTASALNSAFNAYTVNAQTGTTYTFVLTDQGGLVTASNASASTYTVPTNASVAYATGTRIELLNIGAGTVTLSPAGGVTLTGTTIVPQNARVVLVKQATNTWYVNPLGGGGLTFITSATASASATVSINNCFTSAFENYRIVMAGITSSTPTNISLRLRVGGVDNSTAGNYLYGDYFVGSGASTAAGNGNAVSAQQFFIGDANGSTSPHYSVIDVYMPQATVKTAFSSLSTGTLFVAAGGLMSVTTSYDGFSIVLSAGTITSGTNGIRVYGYSNS